MTACSADDDLAPRSPSGSHVGEKREGEREEEEEEEAGAPGKWRRARGLLLCVLLSPGASFT
jgi:hypothetical protein